MPPSDPGHLGIEILNSSRRWVRLRMRLKVLLDSKTASEAQVNKVRLAYNKESEELERHVRRLEVALAASGQNVPMTRRPQNPIPWQQLFTLLAKVGAEGLNGALNGVPPVPQPHQPPQNRPQTDETIIDAEFEET